MKLDKHAGTRARGYWRSCAMKRAKALMALAVLLLAFGNSIVDCGYIASNGWSSAFTGAIRTSNTTPNTINGLSVNWQYSGGNRISSS